MITIPYKIEGYSLGPRDLIVLRCMYEKDPSFTGLTAEEIWNLSYAKIFTAKNNRVYVIKNKAIIYERLNSLISKGLVNRFSNRDRSYLYKLSIDGIILWKSYSNI